VRVQPANDPNVDYRELVQRSYDACAEAYGEARQREAAPELALLTSRLEPGAAVLDIGCGAGVPIARTLAQHFVVTGVDISDEQIRRAKLYVPNATFTQGDMLSVAFSPSSFDAVVAFYSIFHTPREEHVLLFQRIHEWLKPHGYLLATLALHAEEAYTEPDFFGVTMYWSNYGIDEYRALLERTGFEVLETTVLGHGYDDADAPGERHPLIFARKV
jgi:cyclopropane fatty-acyl-phospholipid synthase-like methyltransferase